MEIFISEFVCGGGWPEDDLPQSLAVEGAAMLRALCADCARLTGAEVVTTLDPRCSAALPAAIEVIDVARPDEEWGQFLDLSVNADVTIVIAPELNDTLTRRVRAARDAGANVLAPATDVTELCSDKLRLARFLAEHDVPTIPTFSLSETGHMSIDVEWMVVKPRFGAGSHALRVVPFVDAERLRQPPGTLPVDQQIVQPRIEGDSFSVATIADTGGNVRLLPVARQRLSTDGERERAAQQSVGAGVRSAADGPDRVDVKRQGHPVGLTLPPQTVVQIAPSYLGGTIPWNGSAAGAMHEIVRRCHTLLEGMAGYIGFDFVVPDDAPERPLLVEINPRLCTSYLGYRRLSDENLAARMLPGGPVGGIAWKDRLVEFLPDGSCNVTDTSGTAPCV